MPLGCYTCSVNCYTAFRSTAVQTAISTVLTVSDLVIPPLKPVINVIPVC